MLICKIHAVSIVKPFSFLTFTICHWSLSLHLSVLVNSWKASTEVLWSRYFCVTAQHHSVRVFLFGSQESPFLPLHHCQSNQGLPSQHLADLCSSVGTHSTLDSSDCLSVVLCSISTPAWNPNWHWASPRFWTSTYTEFKTFSFLLMVSDSCPGGRISF